jgi:hypothetical protein
MNERKRNLPASVTARLQNQARQTGGSLQTLLTSFCFERFLYRLGQSAARDRFVLKGAMLLRLWSDQPYRATGDLDLQRHGDGSFDAIRADIEEICSLPVEPDAVVFDTASMTIEPIRTEDEYAGARVTLLARCGTARLTLRIDIGVGDAVWPPARARAYPTLLDFPQPTILAYPQETVIAEKLEAIVVLGDRNSRIKDHFDLQYLASHFEFDRPTLSDAIRLTFERRRTPVPADEPIGLTTAYWDNPSREAQARAFARRAGLAAGASHGEHILALLRPFLLPILDELRDDRSIEGHWSPGGPWRP